jgi:hypothetical protein
MSRCKFLEWKIEISPKSIQTIRLSIPITMRSLKWIGQGVLNLQRYIRKIVWLFVCPFHISRSNLRTPWPIHFKFHSVIGIDSLMVCILFGEMSNFMVIPISIFKLFPYCQVILLILPVLFPAVVKGPSDS